MRALIIAATAALLLTTTAGQAQHFLPGFDPERGQAALEKKLERRKREHEQREEEVRKRFEARIEQARQEAAVAAAAEAERQREAEERIRQLEEERAKVAAEARKPINRLHALYWTYRAVQACHEFRRGYLAVLINDIELARAKDAATYLERQIVAEDPSLDPQQVWKSLKGPDGVFPDQCRPLYFELVNAVPRTPIAKDFGR
jgi:hypothetical protein